jgi:hypothetical protein
MDFTLSTFHQLLKALKHKGFFFQTFSEFLPDPKDKVMQNMKNIIKRTLYVMPDSKSPYCPLTTKIKYIFTKLFATKLFAIKNE